MSTTFAAQINGDDIYAKRAECDAAGNTLSTTYATKAELPEGVPPVTSSDNNKVLKASYSEGTGSFSWQTESGGGGGSQVQSDWTESDDSDPSYIQNKPTILGLTAGSNVTITEGNDSVTIAATDTTYTAGTGISISNGAISNSDPIPSHTSTESGKVLGVDNNGSLGWVNQSGGSSYSAGTGIDISSGTISVDTTTVAMKTDIPSVPVTDVTVDGTSVVNNGTAAITLPTVPTTDQTYNSSSTNPQSGTAVAGAISGVAQVPPVTSSDDTKVLTASYTGGVASYAWQTAQGGGGGGTSNVTTADKQINVAVNGTGVPMQLNLLNPVAEGTANLGIPTVSAIEYPNPNSLVNQYAVMLDWTFSKSAIDFSIPASGGYFPLTLTISNNTTIIQGNERTYDSDSNMSWPTINDFFAPPMSYLLDAANDTEITSQSMQGVVSDVGGASAQPPGDIQFNAGTYYRLNGFPVYITDPSYLESASTLKLRIGLFPQKSYVSGQGQIPCTQSEVETFAARVSQNASNFTLTAPSANPTGYTAYIGATSISGHTTTADSTYSGLYRYDFSASETAALVPGTYLVQVEGPVTSGTQSTYVCLYKNGNTGYSSYTSASKTSYLSGSGSRSEVFLMNVLENTTSIGTKKSYGQFTMVRLG